MKRLARALATTLSLALCAVMLAGCNQLPTTPDKNLQAKIAPPTIKEEGVLRVGVDAQNAPFASQASGKIVGLDVDVAAALADRFGLKLRIQDVGSDPEGALKNGDVDIVMGIDKNDGSHDCWMSEPYVRSAIALFAPENVNKLPAADAKAKISAQSSSLSAWEVANQFGDDSFVPASDLSVAFDNLKDGRCAYVAADAVIGSYVVHNAGGKAHIVALMKQASGYCIGVYKENKALSDAVADALSSLDKDGILSLIETKWVGTHLDLSAIPLTAAAREGDKKDEKKDEKKDAAGQSTAGGQNGQSDRNASQPNGQQSNPDAPPPAINAPGAGAVRPAA